MPRRALRRLRRRPGPPVSGAGPLHPGRQDSLADATAGLLGTIGLHRADVLGWSMGGFVAQRLAIEHPGRVSRLILAGTNPGGSQTVLGTPAATVRRQVAAENPWLRSNANYRQLAGATMPTLAAAGARDPVVPPVNLRRIAARIPRSRFAVFPGAHAFLFQSRRAFVRAVDGWLRVESPAAPSDLSR